MRWISFLVLFAATTLLAQKPLTVTWLSMPVHGLAVVVQTPEDKVWLIDVGGVGSSPAYDAGKDAISPFLKERGITEIEGIIISHPHGDHFGGSQWLLQNWRVHHFIDHGYEGRGQTLGYTRLRGLAVEKGATHSIVTSGETLDWGPGLTVTVLSPPQTFISKDSDPSKVSDHGLLNSNSIVLRVQHGANVFLFPGDSYGGAFEQHIKTLPPEQVKATVLTANHHGFNPGFDFPKLVTPKFVVASCVPDYPSNANTPYPRSPGDNAIKVYGALGAEVFVTAFHGNITAVSDGKTVSVSKQHERAAP